VLCCGRLLTASVSIDTGSSHWSWWSPTNICSCATMVRLYRMTWPFVCGWYDVDYTLEIPTSEQTRWNNEERKWERLSDSAVAGGPYAATQ